MLLVILLLLIILFYLYSTRNHGYFTQRNIKHDRPLPLFGNHFRNIFGIKSITDISVELYRKYPEEKMVGYFRGNTPVIILRDPDLVRQVLNVDFANFYKRGLGRNPALEPVMLNLFHVEGDKWKLLRQRLTPTFTTGKLRNMFPLIIKCAKKVQNVTMEIAQTKQEYDVRELMARFTTEFIGACGFGIEMDTINNENSKFRELGTKMFKRKMKNIVAVGMFDIFPELNNYFDGSDNNVLDELTEIFLSIRQQRNGKPIGRHDFIDLLLELEEKKVMTGESIERRKEDGSALTVEMEFDLKCAVAQIFVFFAAGFETSSSATSFTLHQLAYNPDIQHKIQEEIDTVLSKYNNEICYNAITEMPLLNCAFKEAMRMFPSLGVLNRVAANKYTFPDINITIDSGVNILIPIQAIQTDEKYFENPDEFKPERFLEDSFKTMHKFVYIPFGEGPRQCIGARLGQMQSLAGLAAVLQKVSVRPSTNSSRKLPVNPLSNVIQSVLNGVPLKILPR